MNKKQKRTLSRIVVSIVLTIGCLLVSPGWWKGLLFLLPYGIIGYDILKKALKGLLRGRPFDENFLMAISTVGAFLLGEYVEGTAVMVFYQIGELFQSYAVGKSRRSIREMMDIRPDYANIEGEKGEILEVAPEEVEVGTVILVKPGEKIPIDGIVVEGYSTVNTSALTGESLPRDVFCGDEVASGCINLTGLMKIKTTKRFEESTVSKILELVENTGAKKAPSEKFISKFARVYTPAVCLSALLLAILPPLISMCFGMRGAFAVWIYRALTFLVISCPCALVISIPLSFFASIGGASRIGVLVKGANILEMLSKVKDIVFDKTGTMTQGVFEVVGVHHNSGNEKKLLEYAAHAESHSSHPISQSLQRAYGEKIDPNRVADVQERTGYGVTALVDGKSVSVGNDKWMEHLGVSFVACQGIGTVVHVAIDGSYEGHILIADRVKPEAKEAILALKKIGIRKTVMLTGDSQSAANSVAQRLGIDAVYAELLPTDKVFLLEKMLKEKKGQEKIAFVGDGLNDAPVLTRADVGIAMGALGSDAAIEAADVVLMDDNPLKIVKAIHISQKCMWIVRENICLAIGVKVGCLLLGAIGIANMWLAIFADVGVMVLAILNAIRALHRKKS